MDGTRHIPQHATHPTPTKPKHTYQRRVEQEVAGEEVQLVPRRRRAPVPVQRLRLGLGGPQFLFVSINLIDTSVGCI